MESSREPSQSSPPAHAIGTDSTSLQPPVFVLDPILVEFIIVDDLIVSRGVRITQMPYAVVSLSREIGEVHVFVAKSTLLYRYRPRNPLGTRGAPGGVNGGFSRRRGPGTGCSDHHGPVRISLLRRMLPAPCDRWEQSSPRRAKGIVLSDRIAKRTRPRIRRGIQNPTKRRPIMENAERRRYCRRERRGWGRAVTGTSARVGDDPAPNHA
ncbi:hypothetical protein VNO77_03682 [Canavalia gladiata]|uniref:Uncharacterized protein n=1 Tax=Canavalia gladiata TaxID=3824 RepID=A0AAN9N0B1_CANGL